MRSEAPVAQLTNGVRLLVIALVLLTCVNLAQLGAQRRQIDDLRNANRTLKSTVETLEGKVQAVTVAAATP